MADWTEDTILRLRKLWAEGHSTSEIGRRLGVTKNSIVGKSHRLDLPARPSPIRTAGSGKAPGRKKPRVPCPVLPALPSLSTPLSITVPTASPRASAPTPRPAPQPVVQKYGRVEPCCWPIGEPGTRSFRYCDDASVPGRPYCADHVKIAYVRVRDRREDNAVGENPDRRATNTLKLAA